MKLPIRGLQISLLVIFAVAITFTYWGLFDEISWCIYNGQAPFPAPFFLFYLNPYTFADILITTGIVSLVIVIGLAYMLGKKKGRATALLEKTQ
jgi:hypothetical protein